MSEPVWLTEAAVVGLHGELIAEHGGLGGVRDRGLLESALTQQLNLAAYGEPTLFELAAAYAFGLARNHPFNDGNKRVALAAADVFLQLNGHEIRVSEPEAVSVMRDLAAGEIGEGELAAWIERRAEPV